jgi:hypothetical protein
MTINYSSILTKAWNFAWKYKVLWFFGFLAALGGSGFGVRINLGYGSPNIGFGNRLPQSVGYQDDLSRNIERSNMPPEWKSFFEQIAKIDLNTWITIAVAALCAVGLLVVVIWLFSIFGRGGLIGGILSADDNGKVTFREAWGFGQQYFWRLLLIQLLAILVNLVVGLIVLIPTIFLAVLTCGIGFIPMICVGIVITFVLQVWFAFMGYAIVVEKCGIGEAIGRAWTVLADNIGPIAILYLILFAVSLGVGLGLIVLFAPSGAVIFLSLLPLITGSGVVNSVLLTIGIVLLVLTILAAWLVRSVQTVWETSVMVLAYREFIRRPMHLSASAGIQAPTA